MAKESGLGWTTLAFDDSGGSARNLVNDFPSFEFATPRAVQDVTGSDKSAFERILLLADLSFSGTAIFNDASNRMHDVFKTVPSTSVARTLTLTHSGQTLASEVLITDYSLSRGADGGLTATIPAVLADGTVPTWA